MEGHCSIGQSPQWAVVTMEEGKGEEEEEEYLDIPIHFHNEQPIFPYRAFTYWSFYWRCTVLVVR